MEKKRKFYEVVLRCPLNNPHKDCAFNRYRQMSITELIETTQLLNSADYDKLLANHNECIEKRNINKLAG